MPAAAAAGKAPAVQLTRKPLQGRHVRLEPITAAMQAPMRACLDCDAEGWALVSSTAQGEAFEASWAAALRGDEAGDSLTFAILGRADGKMLGKSSFMNLRLADGGLEIGSTFIRPEARGAAVNPEAKLLMLTEAFEAGAMRVELRTDALNLRSQAAIAKLGAVREGVLRRYLTTWTGRIRDTVVFAITDLEWPAVRERLQRRLAGYEADTQAGSPFP